MDGGDNFIGALDVDQLGTAVRRDLVTTVEGKSSTQVKKYTSTPGGAPVIDEGPWLSDVSVSARRTALGEGVIDDLQLSSPTLGNYAVTISSPALASVSFDISITAGQPSSLDACGCPTCFRRADDGICVDTLPYRSDVQMPLRFALVVMRDAGGALVNTTLVDTAIRNVTAELIYGKNDATGQEVRYTPNATLLSEASQVRLIAEGGMVAWCRNGTAENPIPQFCLL